jgi:hypothetical protein
MTYLKALLAGIFGAAAGSALGAGLASLLAPALGITEFEGAAGYFVVLVGGPVGALLGFALGAVVVLRRSGHRGIGALGGRLALLLASVVALGAAGLAAFWLMRPIVNPDGPAPQLVFEIRLPPGAEPPPADRDAVELQTARNRMPARLTGARREDGRTILAGSVEMYYRTAQRALVLTMPDRTDVLFDIRLGRSPNHAPSFTAWQRADHIAEPGRAEVRRSTPADRYEVRYRTVWPGNE